MKRAFHSIDRRIAIIATGQGEVDVSSPFDDSIITAHVFPGYETLIDPSEAPLLTNPAHPPHTSSSPVVPSSSSKR